MSNTEPIITEPIIIDFNIIVFENTSDMESYSFNHKDDHDVKETMLIYNNRIYYILDSTGSHSIPNMASAILFKYFQLYRYSDWKTIGNFDDSFTPTYAPSVIFYKR